MSCTVASSEGSVSERFQPQSLDGRSWARTKASTVLRGLSSGIQLSGRTGQMASCPASGSRMIEDAKVDAARFGLPGRTTIVGRRSERPSTKPLRV